MFSVFNRFIDWFLMKDGENDASLQSPAQIMQGIGDVVVLVAQPDGKFTSPEIRDSILNTLIETLNLREGVALRRVPNSFSRKTKGSLSDQFGEVLEKGRALLEKEKADLLLWGHDEIEEEAIRWFFLSSVEGEVNLGVPGYAENILVPYAPEENVLNVVYAALFAATRSEHPSHALKIGEHLLAAVDPLTKLSTSFNARKMTAPVQASVMGMASVILANMARRGEGLGWFPPAIEAFESWEGLIEKDKALIEWALIKSHQGWLYEIMADHEDDPNEQDHIEKALAIFEEVCSVFSAQKFPLEWAAMQLRIAGTCAKVGRRRSTAEFLQKAARHYRRSLEVYSFEAYPLNWADVTVRMAKVMMLHGQMVKGGQSLEQAGVAFQAALKVYTEDKYPALWASTQNNLGATLFALAKRDHSTPEWLAHALICFDGARRYYEETGRTKMVHVIDKNIDRAQDLKNQIEAERENDLLN